jgi:hypothetical protein
MVFALTFCYLDSFVKHDKSGPCLPAGRRDTRIYPVTGYRPVPITIGSYREPVAGFIAGPLRLIESIKSFGHNNILKWKQANSL